MIHLTALIAYLRQQLPAWRIDGAAELEAAVDRSRLQLPAMYVGLGDCNFFDDNELGSEYRQTYDERIYIWIGFPNFRDDTGKYAQDHVLTARSALLTTLVNYTIDSDSHGIRPVRDRPVTMDRARYWHLFEYKVNGLLDWADAAQPRLDNFDRLTADINIVEADSSTHPNAQINVVPLYFTPDRDDE